jgi:hypothetical protein
LSQFGYDPVHDPLLVSRSGPEYDRLVSETYAQVRSKAGPRQTAEPRIPKRPGKNPKRPYRKCREVHPSNLYLVAQ